MIPTPVRRALSALVCSICLYPAVWSQEPGLAPSLGDLARREREERSAHSAARQTLSNEEDGPDHSGVWHVQLCTLTQVPCYDLAVTLPKTLKWRRAEDQPRPVLISLPGLEDDPSHSIRVYVAQALPPMYAINIAKRTLLQSWFSRPEYFGEPARLVRDEHVKIDNSDAAITQFVVGSGAAKYRGLSVVATSPYGNYGFACAYRDEDSSVASSICEAVIKSATIQTLQPRQLTIYPGPYYPPYYYPPPDDDP